VKTRHISTSVFLKTLVRKPAKRALAIWLVTCTKLLRLVENVTGVIAQCLAFSTIEKW